MSYNYNHVTLVGRLTRDPESLTMNDTKRSTFTLAINRKYKKEDGSQEADFIPVVTWGKLAEISVNYLKKGHPVLIEGRVQVRSYSKEDQTFWKTEIVGETMQLLSSADASKSTN